jgi:hypothetical protein
VPYTAIQPVFLPPADARAAFEKGAVDAWVIWDPFFAAAEKQLGARILADGSGLVSNHQFYLASRGYADKHPQVVQAIVDELARLDAWAEKSPKDVASLLAPQIGLPAEITEIAAAFAYGINTPAVAVEQQKIDASAEADRFGQRCATAKWREMSRRFVYAAFAARSSSRLGRRRLAHPALRSRAAAGAHRLPEAPSIRVLKRQGALEKRFPTAIAMAGPAGPHARSLVGRVDSPDRRLAAGVRASCRAALRRR